MSFKEDWEKTVRANSCELYNARESRFCKAIEAIKSENYFEEFSAYDASETLLIINIYVPILGYLNCKIANAKKGPSENIKPLTDVIGEIIETFKKMQYVPQFVKDLCVCVNINAVKAKIAEYKFHPDNEAVAQRFLITYKAGELLASTSEIEEKDVITLYQEIKKSYDVADKRYQEEIKMNTILTVLDVQKIKQKTN